MILTGDSQKHRTIKCGSENYYSKAKHRCPGARGPGQLIQLLLYWKLSTEVNEEKGWKHLTSILITHSLSSLNDSQSC